MTAKKRQSCMREREKTMAKAMLICGKIASGKTVYARELAQREKAVILSVDEITLRVFGGDLGERHDEIARRTQAYLFDKSLEVLRCGTSVILDWGFWTRGKRGEARAFYEAHGFSWEMHYVDAPEDIWERNIEKRNADVLAGKTQAYLVDQGLREKLEAAFEAPERREIDVWYVNRWK